MKEIMRINSHYFAHSSGVTKMSDQADAFEELQSFDESFDPTAGAFRPGLDSLPDGTYHFTALRVGLERTQNTREAIVRWELKVDETGGVVEKVNFFKSQQNADSLGGELMTLGIPAHTWTAKEGKRFSEELPPALPKLAGIRFVGTKRSVEREGKKYHNLYIDGRAPDLPVGEPTPNGAPPANAPTEDSIPF
jgi:hypothetical protein